MGRVLVTGATGFIGYEVARQLADRGHRPRLLVRRPLRATLVKALDAEVVQGDLERRASLVRAVRDVDVVLHLGARAIFEEYRLVRPTIVDGTIALLQAAIEAGVKQFVYASSLLVYADVDGDIDAETPARPTLGYGRAKLEAESELAALAETSPIVLSILRLPHVYGARDLMFDQIRQSRVVFPGNGRNQFAHMHVEDAARILIAVMDRGWGGVSPVADDAPVSWNEFFRIVREYYPRFRYIGMPQWIALAGMYALTPLRRLSRYPSLYTADAVRGWNAHLPVKRGLLWGDLGLAPKYPTVYEGVPAALDDSVAFRWIHPVADRVG